MFNSIQWIFFQNFSYIETYVYAFNTHTQQETRVRTIGKSAKQIFLKKRISKGARSCLYRRKTQYTSTSFCTAIELAFYSADIVGIEMLNSPIPDSNQTMFQRLYRFGFIRVCIFAHGLLYKRIKVPISHWHGNTILRAERICTGERAACIRPDTPMLMMFGYWFSFCGALSCNWLAYR